MSRLLIMANWKMNGGKESNQSRLDALREMPSNRDVQIGVCVPYIYLSQTEQILKNSSIAWGAQDVSVHSNGSYTGDISTSMLQDYCCSYVIVGHSERRQYHNETNELVAQKALAVLNSTMTPIICVGESLRQRKSEQTLATIEKQLSVIIAVLGKDNARHVVIAYEPVWAIGTGLTASPENAQEIHRFIRNQLGHHTIATKILYGGSLNASSAKELFLQQDIDGGLVGGASLKSEDFSCIIRQAQLFNNAQL